MTTQDTRAGRLQPVWITTRSDAAALSKPPPQSCGLHASCVVHEPDPTPPAVPDALWAVLEPPAEPPTLALALAEGGRFVRALFDPADHVLVHPIRDADWGAGPGGEKHWFTIADDELDDALAWVWQRNNATHRGQCAFFGANPRRGPGLTGNTNVPLARAYFADFDGVTLAAALNAIRGAGFPFPSIVVRSGGGVHAYWLLHDAVDDLAEWRHRQKWIAAALGSDGAVCDPQRLMRLPGFPNRKRKYADRDPVPMARLVACDAGRRFSWHELEPRSTPEPRMRTQLTPEQVAALPPVPVGSVSRYSRRFLHDGWVSKAGRRMTAFHVAGDLAARGWTVEAATAAIVARLRALNLPARELDDIPRQVGNAFARPRQRIVDPDEVVPPGRVEEIPARPTAAIETIRDAVREQLAWVLEHRPPLAVVRAGTGGAKTTTAAVMVAATPGRVLWNVPTHDAATAVVAIHQHAGHTDVAAMPPRNEHTCRCWTRDDVRRVAAAHGVRPGPSMEQALAVGSPISACVRCPLWPQFKRPAGAPTPTPDPDLAAFAPADDAAMADAFADPWAEGDATEVAGEPAAAGGCRYWQLVADAERARIVVQCQQRTERRPDGVEAVAGETLTVVTDEHALAVLRPRRVILVEELQAVANVLRAAAYNRGRPREHRSHAAHVRAMAMPTWLSAMADVADRLVAFAQGHAAAGTRAVLEVPDVRLGELEQPPHTTVMAVVAAEELPAAFNAEALDLVWRATTDGYHGARVFVEPDGAGEWHATFHRSWDLQLPPGACHVVLDATADVDAVRRVRPDAVVLDPPGAAATVHTATQWWHEVNNSTHPGAIVDWLERALDHHGWQRAAVCMPKRHRAVLFPQSRRRGQVVDMPADVEAIAKWNGRRRELVPDDSRRMAAARELAERVARLRARIAVDANGNAVVFHHHGERARGSNALVGGTCDGLVCLGHVRRPSHQLASYLLATLEHDAAAVDGRWGWVEGEVPTVDGGTRTARWRGYADERWAAAARALNRADLEQLHARARANLAAGVPLVVVAAEPCGLPVGDAPAKLPPGVAAVVAAVRQLVAGGAAGGPTLTGKPGQPGRVGNFAPTPMDADVDGGESRKPCTGDVGPHSLIHRLRDSRSVGAGALVAAVTAATGASSRAAQLWLADAVAMGLVARHGAARATTYGLPGPPAEVVGPPPAAAPLELATGVVPATTVVLPMDELPVVVGGVGGHLAGAAAAIVTPAPCPRDANAPATVTAPSGAPREPAGDTVVGAVEMVAKMSTIVEVLPAGKTSEIADTSPAAPADDTPVDATAPRYRLPANAPRLTGAARSAMVQELRTHLRAVAFNARLDKLQGNERDDLTADEVVALFADAPTGTAQGP